MDSEEGNIKAKAPISQFIIQRELLLQQLDDLDSLIRKCRRITDKPSTVDNIDKLLSLLQFAKKRIDEGRGEFVANSGMNVPLVADCNVPPVTRCNVPPQKWLR